MAPWASAAECVRFKRESFGAPHQMLAGLDEAGREAAWAGTPQRGQAQAHRQHHGPAAGIEVMMTAR